MVELQTWYDAQREERKFHCDEFDPGFFKYGFVYDQYFKYLDIKLDQNGKKIVEIGPADFPALAYCNNYSKDSYVIEPMPSEHLKRSGIKIVDRPAENVNIEADEVWLMNVLQHVIDPHKIVERAKKAKVVRFFEPINYGVDECHLWNLTTGMFKEWFGDCVNYYPKNNNYINFHQWECAYGVYVNVQ